MLNAPRYEYSHPYLLLTQHQEDPQNPHVQGLLPCLIQTTYNFLYVQYYLATSLWGVAKGD